MPLSAPVNEANATRFEALFGTGRGSGGAHRPVSAEQASLALGRLNVVFGLLNGTPIIGLTTSLMSAITQLAKGGDPRAEERIITVSHHERSREHGRHQATVAELVCKHGLKGLYGALILAAEGGVVVGETTDFIRYDVESHDPAAVALQVAWLIICDWEWLTELGIADGYPD